MKKITALAVFVLAFAFVTGCSKKATKDETQPTPAVTVAPEPVAVQTPVVPPVDPKVAAAQQKYLDGLKQFDLANYKGSLKTWQDCIKLDPKNEDCQAGVRAANDMIKNLTAKSK
ncbi:MAG: hypothetical protein LBI01_06685 [Elusimicrobium sp.]|jgi:hypothetical protein|nr:hypothetical protein [Elusimicrobium sp.]